MAHAAAIRFIRYRFSGWRARRHPAAEREICLHRRRIYILPTRYGCLFALLLFVMLLGAMNYSNSMAFALTFLLASLGLNAMWHTHRNLLGLHVVKGHAKPVFAGQVAHFKLNLHNPTGRARQRLAILWRGHRPVFADAPAGDTNSVDLGIPARTRGWLRPGRFRVFSYYPLGLFRAWSWLELDMAALVYPQPAATAPPLPAGSGGNESDRHGGPGREDYAGLRDYQPGDSPRHIAWKALARSDDLLTKQFAGETGATCWLEWDQLPGRDIEARLSILCRWVLEAHARGLRYGLRIPGRGIAPGNGDEHRRQCLRALALFGFPEKTGY